MSTLTYLGIAVNTLVGEIPCNIPEIWMIYHVWIFAKI
jgi:hypothetical protein